jgi:hypothetical protein
VKVPRKDAELEHQSLLTRDLIQQTGHKAFVAPLEIASQGLTDPNEFMPFVRQHIEDCDLMIVLYHSELRGGLIELGLAYAHKIPIWLCYKPGEKISGSALGCAELTLEYSSSEDLRKKMFKQLISC